MPDSEYIRLYQTTDWMFSYAFGEQVDLHLFDNYWSEPPPIKSFKKKMLERPKYTKHIPNPEPDPTHDLGISADYSTDTTTKIDTSEPADAGTSADADKRVDASGHADAGARADASQAADASARANIDKTCTDSSLLTVPENPLPYINLCPVACSASLQEYQQLHGMNAHVYVASSTVPYADSTVSTDTTAPSENTLSPIIAHANEPTSSISLDNKNDILTQGQMFKALDAPKFIACQQDEISVLYDLDIMDALPILSLPPKARLLCSIWRYCRKRLPNGTLLKYKACLCVNGKEHAFGRDYWETYAPVAARSTIRLLLYLSTILNLHTRQVDYTSAFPQADLDVPVYMRVPQGWYVDSTGKLAQHRDSKFQDKDHYLKLKKNLYGCKQAAHNWFKKLSEGLLREGFVKSKTDSCLFMRHDCIIVVYVDNCLFFSPNKSMIGSVIASLSTTFKLKDEGDVSAFLAVQINKDPKAKTISFTQPGLIDQIIRDVGITRSSKGKDTPVDSILYADADGPPRVESWNYRSILGKLNYLANYTRPDISMAVHQCARFCSAPRALHELAIKLIVRYLLATRDKGMVLTPNMNFNLDMLVDANFAGRWHKEVSHLRDSVLSRTGYVVTFCGCPISWSSKLQSEIALSTTESEYIALSSATRELLPLRRVLLDLVTNSFISIPKTSSDTISTQSFSSNLRPSQVFEDNTACITLATSDSTFKPCTKHISLKFHHFHDHIRNGSLRIVKVASNKNWADIFTKPLGKLKFEHLRKYLICW